MVKTYTYKAKNRKGKLMTGTLLADSENAVALHIRKKDGFVLQIKEKRQAKTCMRSYGNN